MIELETYLFANVNEIMDLSNYHESLLVGERLSGKLSINKADNPETHWSTLTTIKL